jgi:YidC/Oxa1 family membrane protein insertase
MESKNLLLAVVMSVVILFGFQYVYDFVYPKPETPPPSEQGQVGTEAVPTTAERPPGPVADSSPPAVPGTAPDTTIPNATIPTAQDRAKALADVPRVRINTPRLHGSISLQGGRIDDLTLAKYHETLDPKSPEVVLFSPPGAPKAYFAEVGWVSGGGAVALPDADTIWTADRDILTSENPVTLTWENGAGLTFKRVIAVDENYLFTITQQVENNTSERIDLNPYALVSRHETPKVSGFYILHEGPLGVFDGTLKEVDYDELQEVGTIATTSTGGWIGITDKYWLAALAPEPKANVNARFVYQRVGNRDKYQVDIVGDSVAVAPGGTAEARSRIFGGAKVLRLLQNYETEQHIDRFTLAIDFGWFWFITRPLSEVLIWADGWLGNLGLAILALTIVIKLLFFPLANKSYRAMSQMRRLQPEMVKLRERFGDDKARLNQEMMALYKREKVNPTSGCLPMIIQIPVFFSLYKVLFVTIEMRHAPFFGWIQDLSAPDPTSVFNLFGLIPWHPPEILMIGAWPLIMGITMFLQQKLNPQPPDPMQAKIFMALPVVFTVMLARFPAGLVIYWTWNNILSIIQQWVIMRRMGVKT